MALAIVQRFLTGSKDGLPIEVSSTGGGTNTTIHTMVSGTANYDQVYLYAANSSTQSVTVYLEWGASANTIIDDVPPRQNFYTLLDGKFIWGRSGTATVLRMYASTSALIDIYGYVNRTTES